MADKTGGILATTKDLITRTKGLDDIHDDLATVSAKTANLPAIPAAVGSAMTLTSAYDAAKIAASPAQVNTEVDTALNTAIPASNTADSVNDILLDQLKPRLPSSGTIATTADLGSGGLSAKEKAFAGLGQPVLNEWFLDVADGAAPNSDFWTTVLSGGTAVVEHDYTSNLPGYLALNTGSSSSQYAIVHTKDKKMFSPRGVVKLCYEVKLQLALTSSSTYLIGLIPYDADPAVGPGALHTACIYAENGDVYFQTGGDTSPNQPTTITSYLSYYTWVTIRVEISDADVKLYVDGTLRATHSTRKPTAVMYFYARARHGTSTGALRLQYVNVWTEME